MNDIICYTRIDILPPNNTQSYELLLKIPAWGSDEEKSLVLIGRGGESAL
jgi:hypothetical protein